MTFAALADPTRRAILARLARGEATVNELAEPFAISLQGVSKHLKVLERAGLIARGRDRQLRPSRLQGTALKQAADWLAEYRPFWDDSFDRLGEHLRELQRGTGMTGTATAHELAITRVYDAPREQVWQAWTEPEQLTRWWGKRGWSAPLSTITMDVRPGGEFSLVNVCDADGREMTQRAVYREVVEPEKLVWAAAEDAAEGPVTTVTFSDLGDGRTEMTFRAIVRMSEQTRDRAAGGLASAFDRLAEHLGAITTQRSQA